MFSRPSLAAVLILILSMDFVAARNLRKRHRHRAPPPAADPKIGVDTTFTDLRYGQSRSSRPGHFGSTYAM
jgi:hypothetical protein